MIKKGTKVFAYQVDSNRTDIATVEEIYKYAFTDKIDYLVCAECGDTYITTFVCPIGDVKAYQQGRNEVMMALKMGASINTLGLSTSTYNTLRRNSIYTIAAIYNYHIEHSTRDGYGNKGINRIRGIGIKARTEIDDLLIAKGLPTLEQGAER